MIVLNTFALGQEVPVSRGELVEIGGSFRLPELMSRSGCSLVEIGTTNRTRASDFKAVLDRAAMLLKIHPSNFYIQGFTQSVESHELAEMAKASSIPSCIDLGSGSLVDLTRWGLPAEPTPQKILAEGIDLVTFSGDKLLGGVQSGIIAGKRVLIDKIRSNPMKRAMRADKITLAVLEATLKLYENPETLAQHLPLLRTLNLTQSNLTARAKKVCAALPLTYESEIIESKVQIGSGALPDETIESIAVRIKHKNLKADSISKSLRNLRLPVVGRIRDDSVLLDMRGADHIEELCNQLKSLNS
jgi:L-seryl-tRNA(Ser) seleniumtransferase